MKNNNSTDKNSVIDVMITAIALFGGYITNTLYIFFQFIGLTIALAAKALWEATGKVRKKAGSKLEKAFIFLFRPFYNTAKYVYIAVKKARKEKVGKLGFTSGLALAGDVLFGKNGIAVLLVSFAIPVISVFFLFSIIAYASSINYAVKLSVNGNFLGYIENEQVFLDAKEVLNERISYFDDVVIPVEPSFSIEQVGNIDTLTKYQIADLILGKSGVNLDYGYGFFINNRFYGALMDFTNVKNTLDGLLEQYKTNNDSEIIDFVDNIRYDEAGLYLARSFIDEESLIETLTGTSKQSSYYTIEDEDRDEDAENIAEKLNMTIDELEKLNPGFSDMEFEEGDKIKVSEEIPFLSISITRTEIYNKEDIPFDTETYDDYDVYEGQSRVVQDGEFGVNEITANVTYVNGVETARNILKVVNLKQPVTEIIALGSKQTPAGTIKDVPSAYEMLEWPLNYGVGEISQWTYWEGGYDGHTGIDIATSYGNPVFACADGIVTKVEYSNYGLGYHIFIYHEELGITSVYGHNSAIHVHEGQRVSKDEHIADVGSTGRSTGPHVHLGVIIDGVSVNPHAYLNIPDNVRINLV